MRYEAASWRMEGVSTTNQCLVNFSRDWISYEQGFGQQGLEFWLGNRKLFVITSLQEHLLRIEIYFTNGSHLFAEYDSFQLSFRNYKLRVGRHRGNLSGILFLANNTAFSTWDRDNDKLPHKACARQQRGAWWYGTTCDTLDLNSMRGNASSKGMVKISMKIKPNDLKRGNYIQTQYYIQFLCNEPYYINSIQAPLVNEGGLSLLLVLAPN